MRKILIGAALVLITGCWTPYYKEVDGTSTILGISLPDEQYVQINALSYLGGSKTFIKEPANIVHEYEVASTNSYLGMVHTREWRKSKITVSPTTNSWQSAVEKSDDPSGK